jgi:hypothetical protein
MQMKRSVFQKKKRNIEGATKLARNERKKASGQSTG